MIHIAAIYIDVLFFVNFIINLTILNTQSLLLRESPGLVRLLGGAFTGALYACLVFTVETPLAGSFPARALVAMLISGISYGKWKLRPLIKRALVFFAITIGHGLCVLGILYFTSIGIRLGGMVKNGIFYFDIPVGFMVLSSISSTLLTLFVRNLFKRSVTQNCVNVTIVHKGKKICLKALTDTGNSLTDPFSGKKVMITEAGKLTFLPDFEDGELSAESLPPGFRLIPFSAVGVEHGLLPAFSPEEIFVDGAPRKDITVGVFSGTLSQNGDFDALVSPL